MPESSNETQELQTKATTKQKVYAYTNKFMRDTSASCQVKGHSLAHAEAANKPLPPKQPACYHPTKCLAMSFSWALPGAPLALR